MLKDNQHIIGKQIVDITLPTEAQFQTWNKRISDLCYGRLNARLEELFDRYSNVDELIRIDKLSIDLGKIDSTIPDDELAGIIADSLEEQLYSLLSLKNNFIEGEEVRVERSHVLEEIFNQWLHFLERGIISWQAEAKSEDELHEIVLASLASEVTAAEKLERLLSGNHRAMERLFLQHSNVFLQSVLEACTAKKQSQLIPLLDDLERLEKQWVRKASRINIKSKSIAVDSIRVRFWRTVLPYFIIEKNSFLENQKIGELVIQLLIDKYEGFTQFIIQELKEGKTNYPVLGRLPEEVLKNIRKPIPKYDSEIKTISVEKADKEETEELLISKEKPENKDSREVDPEELAALSHEPDTQIQEDELDKTISDDESQDIQDVDRQESEMEEHQDISDASDSSESQLSNTNSETKEDTFPDDGQMIDEIKEGIGMYVHYAGIILLHPFLPAFFRKLKLVDGDTFVDEKAKQRAVHLIQYMATGQTELPEYDMPLAKLLCAMPFVVPIDRFFTLNKKELKEADSLLEAAIDHWGALGKTSIGALRESFFEREGKLEKHQQGWQLNIEQKTIDILLQRLPWSISMIKFPWTPDMLRVDWA